MSTDHPAVAQYRPWTEKPKRPPMANSVDVRPGLELTSRYLQRDGRLWIPVSGELHYCRVPRARWRERIRLMKSGGIDVVASYVIWIHHEQNRGQARFDGNLDIAAFVLECADAGLDVVLGSGRGATARCATAASPTGSSAPPSSTGRDDPAYLALVEAWFARLARRGRTPLGRQGPMIGIQIENELYDQPGHLVTLKTMARRVGHGGAAVDRDRVGWGGLPARGGVPALRRVRRRVLGRRRRALGPTRSAQHYFFSQSGTTRASAPTSAAH